MKDFKNVQKMADVLPNRTICPIFSVSNVTGEGVQVLKAFLSKLPVNDIAPDEEDFEITDDTVSEMIDTEYVIDGVY